MRKSRQFIDDTKSQLSSAVMSYLADFRKNKGVSQRVQPTDNTDETSPLVNWTKKESDSDAPVVSKTSANVEPELRVSNLISKKANLKESVRNWQNFWKSPIVPSVVLGSIPALAYYGFSKFTSPDDVNSSAVRASAGRLLREDKDAGAEIQSADHYLNRALDLHKARRRNTTLGIAALSAAILHLPNVNPSNWSQLYKYPAVVDGDKKPSGVRHEASMLGPDLYRTADELRTSIMFDNRLTPEMKRSALGVIDFDPSNHMTSTDVVNNAINSGLSARTGLPLGRIISSAAVDSALGYGIGSLVGADRPGRVAGLFGIGSALINAVKYAGSN